MKTSVFTYVQADFASIQSTHDFRFLIISCQSELPSSGRSMEIYETELL